MIMGQFAAIAMKSVRLRLVELSDARFILDLRLDPKLNQYLSSVDDDLDGQAAWLHDYKTREESGREFYFIIEMLSSSERLGTVRLYDFREESFSWGSWILRSDAPRFAAVETSLAVYDYGFGPLGFAKSHFDVRRENARVIRFHERFGAVRVREDDFNVYYELLRETYFATRPSYSRFIED